MVRLNKRSSFTIYFMMEYSFWQYGCPPGQLKIFFFFRKSYAPWVKRFSVWGTNKGKIIQFFFSIFSPPPPPRLEPPKVWPPWAALWKKKFLYRPVWYVNFFFHIAALGGQTLGGSRGVKNWKKKLFFLHLCPKLTTVSPREHNFSEKNNNNKFWTALLQYFIQRKVVYMSRINHYSLVEVQWSFSFPNMDKAKEKLW